MNIIILGPQASGKGTQAELLAQELNFFHLESGRLLRDVAKKDPRIDEIINIKGKLVPDEETLEYIADELKLKKALYRGVIFDGYPRTINQYNLLKKWLEGKSQKIDSVIFLEISEDTVIKRLSARRICERCGTVYNLITNPPPVKGYCKCGGKLVQRKDDEPETIKKRLTVYKKETEPLVNLLDKDNILFRVDGEKSIDAIFQEILGKIGGKSDER